MQDCWNSEPGLRPTFTELSEKICEVLTDGSRDYLQLDGALTDDLDNQPDIIPPSFKTLPRNFRLRSTDDEDAATEEAILSPTTLQETLHHKLMRQLTVSNPGYTCHTHTSSTDNQLEMVKLKHSNIEA